MLITCFQCRQQLEIPNDSAGKRVRCSHCQHVIVAPVLLKLAEPTAESVQPPATAMPSMELEEGNERPLAVPAAPAAQIPTTNVPPSYPIPPLEVPPREPSSPPQDDDLPPLPSIDRGARRRVPPRTNPGPGTGLAKKVLVGIGIGVVVLVGVVWISASRPHKPAPMPVMPPQAFIPPAPPPPVFIPPPIFNPQQPFNPQQFNFPPIAPLPVALKWQDYVRRKEGFQVKFPAVPEEKNESINFTPMVVHEARQGEWEFRVAHRTLSEKDYLSLPLNDHFRNWERALCAKIAGTRTQEQILQLAGVHPGREWTLTPPDGPSLFVRTYFVKEEDRYHHYLLLAKGPRFTNRFHFEIDRFFVSFMVLIGIVEDNARIGQTVLTETDDLSLGGRREHETMTLAIHPTRPAVVAGTNSGSFSVKRSLGPNLMWTPMPGKSIEQLSLSDDGNRLAFAVAGEIHVWHDWDRANPLKKPVIPGLRCVFARDGRLLVASAGAVKEYDSFTLNLLATTDISDLTVRGLALSADQRQLAVFGDKEIQLWQWPDRKLVGTIPAHEQPITAVTFSPDGKTLASASVDRTIKLWHTQTRVERATLQMHAWTVSSLAFKPDGRHLASGGLDGMLLVWDVQFPSLVWAQPHQFPVRAVAWNRTGDQLYLTCKHLVQANAAVSRQFSRQVRKIAWADLHLNPQDAGKVVAQRAGLHIPSSGGTFFATPDGQTFVSGSDVQDVQEQRQVRVWDAATARLTHSVPAQAGGLLSPDGKWFAFAKPGVTADVHLLELATSRVLPQRVVMDVNIFPQVLFTAESGSLWVQQKNELVRYEVPSLILKQRIKLKEANDPRFAAIFPSLDGQSFLVELSSFNLGLRQRTRAHFASADGKKLPLPGTGPLEASAFVRMRRNGNNLIELEDFANGISQEVGQQRHIMVVSAIHPDRTLAATESSTNDQLLKINFWDLKERRPILTLPDTAARTANLMRFFANGQLFACSANTQHNGWTRVVPVDWLLARKDLLPGSPDEVGPP